MQNSQGQFIQVYVRLRPHNKQESTVKSRNVLETTSENEICVKQTAEKTYTYKRVFGPDSNQLEVFTIVVQPLIKEVLEGYNCTVFAYGQTGSGKTHTISGSLSEARNAGLISRAASSIFKELLKPTVSESTVRISFIELYNEEMKDLLSDSNNSHLLKIYDDRNMKGSTIIQNLTQRTVVNEKEVFDLLVEGTEKRKTAATLLNEQSSRSHAIFTIYVNTREILPTGEDIIRCGKLNLVDLAGSENIGRSGATNTRAREAGNINQSLLALGRVITALVEGKKHIPYRDSKLTRILQDSLGGRTRTCIIATISPSLVCLDETISTLEYASRARKIAICPEANKKITKNDMIKTLTEEAERLRRDIAALRKGSGFYINQENYQNLLADVEVKKRDLLSNNELISILEKEVVKLDELLILENTRWNDLMESFKFTQAKKLEYKIKAKETESKLKLHQNLSSLYKDRGRQISKENRVLVDCLDSSSKTVNQLHDKIDFIYSESVRDDERCQKVTSTLTDSIENIQEHANRAREATAKHVHDSNVNEMLAVNDSVLGQLSHYVSNALQQQKHLEEFKKLTSEFLQERKKLRDAFKQSAQEYVDNTKERANREVQNSLHSSIASFKNKIKGQTNHRKDAHAQISRNIQESIKNHLSYTRKNRERLVAYKRNVHEESKNILLTAQCEVSNTTKRIDMIIRLKNEVERMLQKERKSLDKYKKIAAAAESALERAKDVDDLIVRTSGYESRLEQIPDQSEANEKYAAEVDSSEAKILEKVQEYSDLALKLKAVTEEKSQELGDKVIDSAENCYRQDKASIQQVSRSALNNIKEIQSTSYTAALDAENIQADISKSVLLLEELKAKMSYTRKFDSKIEQLLLGPDESFVQNRKLLKLEPSGETPQKQEYKYKKNLEEFNTPVKNGNDSLCDASLSLLEISNCAPEISLDIEDSEESILSEESSTASLP